VRESLLAPNPNGNPFPRLIAMANEPRDLLETFDNPHPQRDYEIEITAPEFTSICPKTGNPDFGTVRVGYVADRVCIELKSFKRYLFDYRQRGIFYEDVTNVILDDLVAVCRPRRMEVVTEWTPRGGIRSVIRARYEAPNP